MVVSCLEYRTLEVHLFNFRLYIVVVRRWDSVDIHKIKKKSDLGHRTHEPSKESHDTVKGIRPTNASSTSVRIRRNTGCGHLSTSQLEDVSILMFPKKFHGASVLVFVYIF